MAEPRRPAPRVAAPVPGLLADSSRPSAHGVLPAAAAVAGRADALDLIARAGEALDALADLLAEETATARAGDVAGALALEARKSAATRAHLEVANELRVNAVALSRHASDALGPLRERQARFASVVETNLAVLATLRAVAEGLVRGVAEELAAGAKPPGYGPGVGGRALPRPPAPRGAPLLISRSS